MNGMIVSTFLQYMKSSTGHLASGIFTQIGHEMSCWPYRFLVDLDQILPQEAQLPHFSLNPAFRTPNPAIPAYDLLKEEYDPQQTTGRKGIM